MATLITFYSEEIINNHATLIMALCQSQDVNSTQKAKTIGRYKLHVFQWSVSARIENTITVPARHFWGFYRMRGERFRCDGVIIKRNINLQ